ncbi:MAG: bifunctional dihydropteridine reductase/dihydrofolate reductase TmpR [Simkaniaceae bacterium]
MSWTLITGGIKGLGKELALGFAKAGRPVAIHYRNDKKAAELVSRQIREMGGKCLVFQGDFSTMSGVEEFLAAYEKENLETSVLINNVGPYFAKSAGETMPETLQWIFQTNFFAPFAAIQKLLPILKKTKGSVINLGYPELESLRARSTASCYVMAKQSLYLLTKSLAKEYRRDHVRINMISPGYLENSVDLPKSSDLPQGRPVHFSEIVDMALYLCSDKGFSITGQNITVSGGVGL